MKKKLFNLFKHIMIQNINLNYINVKNKCVFVNVMFLSTFRRVLKSQSKVSLTCSN